MRVLKLMTWVTLAAAMACTTTVRDLPPDREADARIAGTLDFSGSRLSPVLRIRSAAGQEYVLRPERKTFVMALPAGRYELLNFGNYKPTEDRLSFDAQSDKTLYIGSFVAARTADGDLRIAIRDERNDVAARLERRYPELNIESGLTQSSLQPLTPGQPLAVAVERIEQPTTVGFGVGYHGYHRRPYRGRYRSYYHRRYGVRYYCP